MKDDIDMLLYKIGKYARNNTDFNPTKPVEFYTPYGSGGTGLKYLEISFKVFPDKMDYARKVMKV